jgi:hypothetical protein
VGFRGTDEAQAVGNEFAEPPSMAGHESIERVNEQGQSQRAKQTAERSDQRELTQEGDAPSVIAKHRRAIAQNQPPALVALALGDAREHALRLRVAEREESELLAAVDPGVGPRRPTTNLQPPA